VPKSNRKFWLAKFAANRRRDALSVRRLKRAGYCVAVVWECEVANETIVATRLSQVLEASRVNMSKTINH
jgi:DNA mismatch endonuclease (patch repair protein)